MSPSHIGWSPILQLSAASTIMETLILPHCWVCDSTAYLHQHHIVPCCYGGTNGPTITLCGNCHGGIHDFSNLMPIKQVAALRPAQSIVPTWEAKHMARVYYLAHAIYLAEQHVLSSSKKWVKVVASLDPETHTKLIALKRLLSCSSQQQVITECIIKLHASLTKR